MVADLRERLIAQNMSINLSDAACALLAKEGTDTAYGARPLRRAIQRLLEDPLSEELLEGKWTSRARSSTCERFRGRREPGVQSPAPAPSPRRASATASRATPSCCSPTSTWATPA